MSKLRWVTLWRWQELSLVPDVLDELLKIGGLSSVDWSEVEKELDNSCIDRNCWVIVPFEVIEDQKLYLYLSLDAVNKSLIHIKMVAREELVESLQFVLTKMDKPISI